MKNPILEKYLDSDKLPDLIKVRIKDVLSEDEAYAADELVSLSEEILLQIAAIGIATYLSQPKQKQVFNDFILELFTSKSHAYNAGPLYRWAANMVKELDGDLSKKIHSLFWKENSLNDDVNKLSKLRNAVMHGFFILPASRNHQEAAHIGSILEQIIEIDLFSLNNEASYHFLSKEDDIVFFNDDWAISEDQWMLFDKSHAFGELTQDIQYELSEKYEQDQLKLVQANSNNDKVIETLDTFINSNDKGSMSIWARPNYNLLSEYANVINHLDDSKYLKVFYSLDSHGINVTDDFLLKRLVKRIADETKSDSYSKDPKKAFKKLTKSCNKQIVVILNNIHISLFNSNHLLNLKDLFYENNILLIAFGNHYPFMDKFFNNSYSLISDSYLPKVNQWEESFINYLRFKGPNKDILDDREAYQYLHKISSMLVKEIENEKTVFARRFAEKYKFPMEYVHEAFSILHPFLKADRAPFELDEIDPLYDFPKEVTESSRVFFSIGRRDAKLEYQHKVLEL